MKIETQEDGASAMPLETWREFSCGLPEAPGRSRSKSSSASETVLFERWTEILNGPSSRIWRSARNEKDAEL